MPSENRFQGSFGTAQKRGSTVSMREQGLGEFGDGAEHTNQCHRAPEIRSRRAQVVRGPDDAEGMEEFAPVGFAG